MEKSKIKNKTTYMKTITRFWAAAAVFAGLFTACSDLDDIKNKVDELDGRLTALETITTNLNKNIEAMQALYSGATVNSATEKDGVWTVVLSNGETLTLNQGSIGVANAPVMSVDKDGYWMVDYDGAEGNAPSYILNGENKVQATGADGKTPLFAVDAEKYWTVSYDAGTTYERVLGADGQPVKAIQDGQAQDSYFSDVKLEGGQLKVTLKTGEQLALAVVPDFLCAIEATGLQQFNAGETKPYNVTIKGVSSTMITAPAGWTATLSEPVDNKAVLTVTAPALTKAVIADSKSDVSILAFSEKGFATIAKINVSISDAPVVINPVASVTAGEATENTLAYNVAVSDVTSWKYIHQKEDETAPDAAKLLADGLSGTDAALSFEGLDANTSYVLYVLPVNGDKQGAIASVKNKTLEIVAPAVSDLYQAYLDGSEIEISGVKYSKTANGGATLLTATEAETDITTEINKKSGVYFLDAEEGASFKTSAVIGIENGELVLIGRHTNKEVTLKPSFFFKLVVGGFAMKNVTLDMTLLDNVEKNTGYFLNNSGTEDLTKVHFDGCTVKNIKRSVYTASTNGCAYAVKSFNIVNSNFEIVVAANTQLFNIYNCSVLDKIEEIVFNNNIVCNQSASAVCQVFNWGDKTAQSGTTWNAKISFCNNTLYNAPSANGHFKFYQVGSLKMNKNLLWADPANENACAMMIIYSEGQTGDNIDTSDNVAYGLIDGKNWDIAHSNSKYKPESNRLTKLAESPIATADFATYTFTPTAEYAGYGAQR